MSQLAWAHAHETLLRASKGKGARHAFNYDLINSPDPDSQVSPIWRIPSVPTREKSHGRHPTEKPLHLIRRAVLASTGEGELVFDPFCGSGTTTVAAKELWRFFVGAEKVREYAELAGSRIGAAQRGASWGRSRPSAVRTPALTAAVRADPSGVNGESVQAFYHGQGIGGTRYTPYTP